MKLRIATRESRLALWQAEHVAERLRRMGHTVELLGMTTRGDQILDRTLSKVGGKGLFVKELETALQEGRADLAVHSLKDVPMHLPGDFVLSAVLAREDPRDAFVSNRHAGLDALAQGARVGTSSLRRQAMLRRLRPDLQIESLRGNLDTRLRKLDEGRYDAIVLAAAGLVRLGLGGRIAWHFSTIDMLPAAGQGALGIEVLRGRPEVAAAVGALNDTPTQWATDAERAVSRQLGGSCSVPLAAHAIWNPDGQLYLRAVWATPESLERPPGESVTCVEASGQGLVLDQSQAEALGTRVAQDLMRGGATVHAA